MITSVGKDARAARTRQSHLGPLTPSHEPNHTAERIRCHKPPKAMDFVETVERCTHRRPVHRQCTRGRASCAASRHWPRSSRTSPVDERLPRLRTRSGSAAHHRASEVVHSRGYAELLGVDRCVTIGPLQQPIPESAHAFRANDSRPRSSARASSSLHANSQIVSVESELPLPPPIQGCSNGFPSKCEGGSGLVNEPVAVAPRGLLLSVLRTSRDLLPFSARR